MLLWAGIALFAAGIAAFAVDRRAAHFYHAAVDRSFERMLHATTDWAKGAIWLAISIIALVAARALLWTMGPSPAFQTLQRTSLAFLVSLAAASVLLHATKIVLGRRRPRDELELNLYGFRPFTFDLASDSFPSGHALTIFTVAVVLSGVVPQLALLWFALAIWLAMTRALLNSHYTSDVLVGAAVGIIVTREVLLWLFPGLARPWF